MSSDTIMTLFDIIIFFFGFYGIYSAVSTKHTHIPPSLLVSSEELRRMKDADGFCVRIYLPTIIFGTAACLYGIIAFFNQYVLHFRLVHVLAALCFFIVCVWYIKKLQKTKEDYML